MDILFVNKATIEEGVCHDDKDCTEKQYCYDVSKQCVDYTQCSRYNRQENPERRSRGPSQCGPCLPGYNAETLGTGNMASLCKKSTDPKSVPEIDKLNYVIVYITIGILLFLMLSTTISCIFFRRRTSKRQGSKPKQCGELCVVEATAPPLESSPFIDCEERSSPEPFNNNKNVKDKNNLVRAIPNIPPNWIRTNPNYENNLSNENNNAMNQLHSMSELSAGDQSNNWSPEHLTLEVSNGNVVGYEIEQVDNSLNTVLVQANNPSSSNGSQEDNNNNSNNGSTSETNNTRNNRERTRTSNILISQKISMNVNLLNDD